MLDFLVTSKVRRRLLSLLWGEGVRGSVAELAALAGVAFAGAHGELRSMREHQLVAVERAGGKDVYAANLAHPDASTLEALVATAGRRTMPRSAADETVRRKLVTLGAPLSGVVPLPVKASERASALLEGVRLARRDPSVARGLPLCVWTLRDCLSCKGLQALTPRAEEKHALAFYLELTGELGGDRRLVGLAEGMRDRRVTALRGFFGDGAGERVRPFPLANKWGFTMNMDRGSFATLFEKFAA